MIPIYEITIEAAPIITEVSVGLEIYEIEI